MPAEPDMIEAIRTAASALLMELPRRAWLPHELKRKANGKLDKPPCCGALTDDPSTWFTLDAALGKLVGHTPAAGIGFAITRGIIGLDFDACRDPATGELTPEVQSELERLNSFAYVTPSLTGIRIMGKNPGAIVPGGKKVRFINGHKVEIFVGPTNHYNTFTSSIIPGYDKIRDISSDVLDYLAYFPGTDKEDATPDELKAIGEPKRSIGAIRAALAVIPNEMQDWDHWTYIGLATFGSSGGSNDGREAFREWSAKHPCHDDAALDERWRHWHRSPPNKLGFGTLYYLARKKNGLFVAPPDPVEPSQQPTPEEAEKMAADIFLTLGINDLMSLPPVEWMLKDTLTRNGFSILYGPPASLKTFLCLDMALCIAGGLPWKGRTTSQCGVLYVAAEGAPGIKKRITAWQTKNRMSGVDLPFRLLPTSVNMTEPDQVQKLIRTALAAASLEGCPIGLVVIDTLARSIPGADENSAQDMGRFVAAAEAIKAGIACHVMGVHHSGKDAERGARGSSALLGAVDTMIQVKRDDTRLTVTVEKQKDDEEAKPIQLTIEMVEWMEGLQSVKSIVLNEAAAPDSHAASGQDFSSIHRQIAAAIGPNGRMASRRVAQAIGITSGNKRDEMNQSIPFYPSYVEVTLPDGKCHLMRTRETEAATSPHLIVRTEIT